MYLSISQTTVKAGGYCQKEEVSLAGVSNFISGLYFLSGVFKGGWSGGLSEALNKIRRLSTIG